jgi:glucose/arabinose dehydrogenase
MHHRTFTALVGAALLAACSKGESRAGSDSVAGATGSSSSSAAPNSACPQMNTGITLPDGFCATIYADSIGGGRHVAVAPNGDVFVNLINHGKRDSSRTNGIVALRDTNADGRADLRETFGEVGGTGIAVHGDFLYADHLKTIKRYPLPAGSLKPSGAAETIVANLPTGGHEARNIAFDQAGALYVNVGSRTNSCQKQDRTAGSPGIDPCAELATRAGIWKFAADRPNQTQASGARFVTGVRNGMGLSMNPADGQMYTTMHGRDQLNVIDKAHYTDQQSAELPAEEFMPITQGEDFGWPYCYFDPNAKKLVQAPEYGGDGKLDTRCTSKKPPLVAFPAHWAPMSSAFYTGTQFPEHYRGGAFIAFHGSWNRAPEPQAGYKVVFVPMKGAAAAGTYETFADGFANGKMQPDAAEHRPVGLAVAPDGALYITDDQAGRVWRVTYKGK